MKPLAIKLAIGLGALMIGAAIAAVIVNLIWLDLKQSPSKITRSFKLDQGYQIFMSDETAYVRALVVVPESTDLSTDVSTVESLVRAQQGANGEPVLLSVCMASQQSPFPGSVLGCQNLWFFPLEYQ